MYSWLGTRVLSADMVLPAKACTASECTGSSVRNCGQCQKCQSLVQCLGVQNVKVGCWVFMSEISVSKSSMSVFKVSEYSLSKYSKSEFSPVC